MRTLTRAQARRFLLVKQGLLGGYRFSGRRGVLDFVRQAGCIQFDPVDVCGRNADLVLQSRVKGYRRELLHGLLYRDRRLIDYPDKNTAIFPTEDWPYFERYRAASRRHSLRYPQMEELSRQAMAHMEASGPVCSDDFELEGDFYWQSAIHWSGGRNLSRSTLEQLYSTGQVVIHHKNGTRKYYDLAERHLSAELLTAAEPIPDEHAHRKWRVLRRIGAVGLLWNRPSDAWLNIQGLTAAERALIFDELIEEGKIAGLRVEGIRDPLYLLSGDLDLLDGCLSGQRLKKRCELIAPLDNLLWDRRLIKALFDFDYKWEIYTPAEKRKYGHYVLPLLYGDGFAGRVEAAADRRAGLLTVRNLWYEEGVHRTPGLQRAVEDCLSRFAAFNGCRLADASTGP